MSHVYTFRQSSIAECGLCCVATAAGYFGFYRDLSYYRKLINVGRDGMTLWDICNFLPTVHLSAEVYKVVDGEHFELEEDTAYIFVKDKHFVVITKKKSDLAQISDPATGNRTEKLKEVISRFAPVYLAIKPDNTFEKQGHRPNEMNFLFLLIQNVWGYILAITSISIIIYLLSIASQMIIRKIINNIAYTQVVDSRNSILAIIGINVFIALIHIIKNRVSTTLQVKLSYSISNDTVLNLFKIRYSYFDNRSQGAILYRLSFMAQLQQTVASSTVQILMAATGIVTLLVYFTIFYSFIVFAVLLMMMVITCSALVINFSLLNYRKKELESKQAVDSMVTEIVNNMMQIRTMHLTTYFARAYNSLFKNYMIDYKRAERKYMDYASAFSVVFDFTPPIILLSMLLLTGTNLTVGEIFLLFSLLGTFFNQCFVLITQIAGIGSLKASMRYFNDMLFEPKEIATGQTPADKFESLELKGVSFQYSDLSKSVIKNISFSLKQGQCIAIVGLSGSGKTTLVKLLSKIYRPTQGKILYNSTDLAAISHESYAQNVVIVPQLPVYFNKSIKDNITLEDPTLTDADVIQSLKMVNFIDDLMNMPFGLDTIMSGQGGNLSGGQIQKITLARALIRRPQLLILDEATSSLDPWNEKEIYHTLKRQGISLMIISHRFSTVQNADEIYVIQGGTIYEHGTHSELLKRKAAYYKLYLSESSTSADKFE